LLALVLGIASPYRAAAQAAPTDSTTDETGAKKEVKMETFEVTGSRIKRIDAEGPNPVTSVTQADFEIAGYSNIGDALRSLPIVSGTSLIPAASNNSFTPGVSAVNFRGLGVNNVLVLLNGRRAAPLSTPGFNGLQTMFDFNSIPTAAVESIEVLKDGGSAIYGADAVSGVIDIKMRKDFRGFTTTAEIGNTVNTDSLEKSFALITGASSGKNSILATVDWQQRALIKDHDYAFSANADTTSRGGNDFRSYAGYPALAYVPSLGWYYTLNAPMEHPTLADFVPADVSHGTYNFQSVTDQIPKTRSYSFYSRATHDFNENFYAFAEIAFHREEAVIGAAPAPVFNYNEHGDGPDTGYLTIPSTNPNNPFGEDLQDEWYARLVHAGNRINDVTSDTPRMLVGVGGKIPFGQNWTWESGYLYTSNDTTNLNRGTVFDNLYQDALNGVDIGGQTLYANPFGPEDPRVTAYYTHEDPNSSKFELRTIDFGATGDLFELPGGSVGLAFGGELRSEKFEDIKTTNNITGNIIGGAEGSSVRGQRNVRAAYAELSIPLFKGLKTQIAGRYESYSDFGETKKPKFALSYRPAGWLLLRGSFGQSFLAPNLSYLYTSQVTQFSGNNLIDPKRPDDAPRQVETRSGGNPGLKPEKTDTYYAGFQIEPDTGAMKGFSLSVDWFQFKQRDLISQLGPDFILAHEDSLPGAVVRNPPATGQTYGTINYIVDFYRNSDTLVYRGIDSEIRYDLKTSRLGQFRFVASSTYLRNYVFQGQEIAYTYDLPRFRGTFAIDWIRGDWSAAVFADVIGSYDNLYGPGRVASQTTINPQISYSGVWKTKITLGARNIFNTDPPFDPNSSTGWNSDINNPEKLFVYVRVAKDW